MAAFGDDLASIGGFAAPADAFTQTQGRILCCLCGASIAPNPANMCVGCVRNQVDITEGIPKEVILLWCKGCGRYLSPPSAWIYAELESRELLALCLKRLKGLTKVHLADASFVWTEPHSRRVKLKVTIEKEVLKNTILRESFQVTYVVQTQYCDDCRRVDAKDTWTAVVQARQKVEHKRTFFYLEQLILKYSAHAQIINVKELPDGLDFFFSNRSHAVKFVDFLQSVVPVRYKASQKLISHDEQNSSYNYKYTFMVEIVPICKNDLVFLPRKVAHASGTISPLVLCSRVSNVIRFLDPVSMQIADLPPMHFWREPFRSLANAKQLTHYHVIDCEPIRGMQLGKMQMADVTVARNSDFGRNDKLFIGRTHLGSILSAGDSVLGYDLTNLNTNDDNLRLYRRAIPDFVLVRKFYPGIRKKSRDRHWQLRTLPKERPETHSKKTADDQAMRDARDYEEFLREVEEDPDVRQEINLYAAPGAEHIMASRRAELEVDDEAEEDFPEVELGELLSSLSIQDGTLGDGSASVGMSGSGGMAGAADSDGEDVDMMDA